MAITKIERVNSQTFKVNNVSYNCADVFPQEGKGNDDTLSLYIKNGSFSNNIFKDVPWADFRNSGDAAYGTFALASAALAAVVVPGDGVSSILTDTGTVTQGTSAVTPVTLNKKNGIITTFSQTLAADTELTFTVTNTTVLATSNIMLTPLYPAASAGTPVVQLGTVSAGSFTIVVTNVNPTNAMNAAMRIGFLVL